MHKKHIVSILIILTFLAIVSFAQDGEFIMKEKNIGIIQMKEAVSKLSQSMTRAEVEELIGKPTFETAYEHVYWFTGGERLTLYYNGALSLAFNKSYFNLLRMKTDLARITYYSVFIDGNELLTSNPIITIGYGTYLPIEEFEEQLEIDVNWNEEKQQLDITTGVPFTDNALGHKKIDWSQRVRYEAKAVDFPVLIDGKKLISSSPAVTIKDIIYLPIEDLESHLKIKISWNKEKQLDIKTDVPFTDIFHREYPALVVDFPVLVDGQELFTLNPILTIYGKTYLPVDEVSEELRIKVSLDEEELQSISVKGRAMSAAILKSIEITTGAEEVVPTMKNNAGIARFKADIDKLKKDMTGAEVERFLGEPHPELNKLVTSFAPPTYYIHLYGGILIVPSESEKLSAIFNKDGFDLLATGYIANTADFPVLIDGKKALVSKTPIVTLTDSSKAYIPIEDLAEQLGIKVSWNEEKGQLEITTK